MKLLSVLITCGLLLSAAFAPSWGHFVVFSLLSTTGSVVACYFYLCEELDRDDRHD